MALKCSVIIHYEQALFFKLKKEEISDRCRLIDLLSFKLTPKVDTHLEKNIVTKLTDKAVLSSDEHNDLSMCSL